RQQFALPERIDASQSTSADVRGGGKLQPAAVDQRTDATASLEAVVTEVLFERRNLGIRRHRAQASGFQHAEAPADADEGIHRLVNLFAGVRGAHLRADARLAPGYDGEEEADDVDAFLEQLLGELLGQR